MGRQQAINASRVAAHLHLVAYERCIGMLLNVGGVRAEGDADSFYSTPQMTLRMKIVPTELELHFSPTLWPGASALAGAAEVIDGYFRAQFSLGSDVTVQRLLNEIRMNSGEEDPLYEAIVEQQDILRNNSNSLESPLLIDGPALHIEADGTWNQTLGPPVEDPGSVLAIPSHETFLISVPHLYALRLAYPEHEARAAILARPMRYRQPFIERALQAFPVYAQRNTDHHEPVPFNPIDGWDGGF